MAERELICSKCGQALASYAEVGYDGPADADGRPDPSCARCEL
jgi:hypothetical protein